MAPPLWARRLASAGQGLLFLDELTTAPPAVQAAMLRVVLERVVGDLSLPEGVRVVAAANPPEEAADGWQLSPPLANRLVHLDWPVDAKFGGPRDRHGISITALLSTAGANTTAQSLAGRAAVGAFLEVRPALVLDVPTVADQAGRGWPSPRSWEAVARLLAACDAVGASEDARTLLVLGAVGEGAGIEFLSWLANMDLPDPEAVLAESGRFRPAGAKRSGLRRAHRCRLSGDRPWRRPSRGRRRGGSWRGSPIRLPTWQRLRHVPLPHARPEGAELPSGLLKMAPVLRAAGLMRMEGEGDPRPA